MIGLFIDSGVKGVVIGLDIGGCVIRVLIGLVGRCRSIVRGGWWFLIGVCVKDRGVGTVVVTAISGADNYQCR